MLDNLDKNKQDMDREEKLVWEEEGIIMTRCVANLGEEKIKEFTEQLLEALERADGKGRAAVNAIAGGGKATTSLSGRKIYTDFGEKARAEKIAIFGINTLQRVVASFIMRAMSKETGIKEVKFFKNKDEAIKWLKE